MKPTSIIEYRGKEYPMFSLQVSIDGETLDADVSVESLDEALCPNGNYADELAVEIDNTIFFFIPDDMVDKSEDEIIKLIEENL